ncbi:aldehyde dehydrogenase family protein [Halobacillus mangrovi]|uniref:aldehyde dehydrogenase family protein n=1 Tax=Halobacillus mangrovi TaxID=402384 RepID=UPI003D962648
MKKSLFLNGSWQEASEYYELTSPYNGEVLGSIPLASDNEVEQAIMAAENGAKQIKKLTALERSKILEKVSVLFEEHAEEAALILAKECAKPLKAARGEVGRTIETYKFAAEEAKRIHGETIPMDAAQSGRGRFGYTVREPVGVVAAITPFNFPFNLVAHKLGPAIASGNSVVLKPAKQTPLSALFTADLFQKAGLPDGGLNVVTGKGSEIGDSLVKNDKVKYITFTGSYEVGLSIREKAKLKKVTLELGSNSAVIIDSTEDIEGAAKRCVEGAFTFSGQVCISVQRIYVKETLYEDFIESFVKETKQLVLGDPLSEEADLSSLIHLNEMERVEGWLEEAVQSGAFIVEGGKRSGNILMPTVLTEADHHSLVNCKEAFAPVVTITKYDDLDEAISFVNDSEYGLQAGIYTESVKKAFEVAQKIEVGGVMVNDVPTFRVDQMPYGGVKNSGTGREGIKYSIEEMTEMKLITFKL